MLMSMFENVTEFNAGGTVRCLKVSPELDFLPHEPVRILTEDFIRYISGHFVFEDNQFSFSSLQTEQNGITFSILQNGKEIKYMGFVIPVGKNCSFCFNRVDSIINDPDVCESTEEKHRVFIKTFGFFDVYKDGKAVCFRCEKAKELLALLIDRRGGFVSAADGAGILWPDEEPDEKVKSRFRKIAMRLNEILKENGIEDIVETIYGKHRIRTENIDCDLYGYLDGNDRSIFHGVYMSNYAWGSETKAILSGGSK